MTVRFNTWITADSIDEAWKQLEKVCGDVYNRESWIEEKFSGTVLEDPEEDKKSMEENDIAREVKTVADLIREWIELDEDGKETEPLMNVLHIMRNHGLIQEEEV